MTKDSAKQLMDNPAIKLVGLVVSLAISDATYYVAGNVHPTTAGQAIIVSGTTTAIQSIL